MNAVATSNASSPVGTWRKLWRLQHWWIAKVGPALAVAYCAALFFHVGEATIVRSLALVAVVGLCAGSYGYVLNDICDLDVDRKAGKPNHMQTFSPLQRALLCVATVVLGFAPALWLRVSRTTLIVLALEYLVLTVYSAPPVRLKSRGLLGMLCDASGAHVVANLFVISVLADGRAPGVSLRSGDTVLFVALVCCWELCLGLLGIFLHQVEDRENDLRSGIRTFATEHAFRALQGPMSLVFAGEVLAFAGLCFVLRHVAPLLAIAAIVYLMLTSLQVGLRWSHYRAVAADIRAADIRAADIRAADARAADIRVIRWWQLTHPFYEAYFPLATSLACASIYPGMWAFAALHALVFAAAFRQNTRIFVTAYTWVLLGGRLDIRRDAAATLWPALLPLPSRRIVISSPGQALWAVRALRSGVALRAGESYTLRLIVRADSPREIAFGVWKDHAPWDGAGYYERLALSRRWQSVHRTFTAPAEAPRACCGLWLGGDAAAVNVLYWSIRKARTPRKRLQEGPNA